MVSTIKNYHKRLGKKSMDINDILKMLDWNNDVEIQEEGRLQASQVNCLNIFMQPMDEQYNKNIWENCAIIISEKKDCLLTPYLLDLLDWLQDLNWPGSLVMFVINHLKCTNEKCRRLHNELPDCMVSYKHYGTEIIEDVIDCHSALCLMPIS